MQKIKLYQKYIYTIITVLFFTIYLGYSLTSGEMLEPNNPYEDKQEEVSKVSLREGLEDVDLSEEETIENKNEFKEPKEVEEEPKEVEKEPEEIEQEPEEIEEEPEETEKEPEEVEEEPEKSEEEPEETEEEPEESEEEPEKSEEEPEETEEEPEESEEEPEESEEEPEESEEEPEESEEEPEESEEEPEESEEEPEESEEEPEESEEEPEESEEEPEESEEEPEEPEEEPEESEEEPEESEEEPEESEKEPEESEEEPEESEEEPEESEEKPEGTEEDPGEEEPEENEDNGSDENEENEGNGNENANEGDENGDGGSGESDVNGDDGSNEGDGNGDGGSGEGDGNGDGGSGEGDGNGDGGSDEDDGNGDGGSGEGDGNGNGGSGEGDGNGDGGSTEGEGNGEDDSGEGDENDDKPITKPENDDYLGVYLKDKNHQVSQNDSINIVSENNQVSLAINHSNFDHFAYEDFLKYIEYIESDFGLKLNETLFASYRVTVNGNEIKNDDKTEFNVGLKAGGNRIKVDLILKDNHGSPVGGKEVHNTKTFFINNQAKSDLIIYTDLEDNQVVHDASFNFRAYAKYDNKLLNNAEHLEVTVNGNKLTEQEEGITYYGELEEGDNLVKVIAKSADGEFENKTVEFTINYQPHLFKFTDNNDGTSQLEYLGEDYNDIKELRIEYNGHYKEDGVYKAHDVKGNLTYISEGMMGEREDDNLYIDHVFNTIDFTLGIGPLGLPTHTTYTITLITKDKSETRTFFTTQEDNTENKRDSRIAILNNPALSHSKVVETQNDKLSLVVQAFDYTGTQLTPGSEKAYLNGRSVTTEHKNDTTSQYIIGKDEKLAPGENKLTFSMRDSTGHETIETYTIIYNQPEEGDEIGTASISLEAGTLGKGTLANNSEIEIIEGETGADLVDRFFKENGIDYEFTGNREADFYIPLIYKEGINKNAKIPNDLVTKLEEGGLTVHPEQEDSNSLGEFDYTAGSGWMYSVNGTYPQIGLADYYFEDGDAIRIRYTLAWGADIGGAVDPDSPFPDLGNW